MSSVPGGLGTYLSSAYDGIIIAVQEAWPLIAVYIQYRISQYSILDYGKRSGGGGGRRRGREREREPASQAIVHCLMQLPSGHMIVHHKYVQSVWAIN